MWSTARIYPWTTVKFNISKRSSLEFPQFANTAMFAVDTNPFSEHTDIRVLFSKVNRELRNINEWFISNKLSLNVK